MNLLEPFVLTIWKKKKIPTGDTLVFFSSLSKGRIWKACVGCWWMRKLKLRCLCKRDCDHLNNCTKLTFCTSHLTQLVYCICVLQCLVFIVQSYIIKLWWEKHKHSWLSVWEVCTTWLSKGKHLKPCYKSDSEVQHWWVIKCFSQSVFRFILKVLDEI